ncbi:unnamed protein product [Prorocentrum cordatum]|nr:unnamed protein product [Polarella glacialis]
MIKFDNVDKRPQKPLTVQGHFPYTKIARKMAHHKIARVGAAPSSIYVEPATAPQQAQTTRTGTYWPRGGKRTRTRRSRRTGRTG